MAILTTYTQFRYHFSATPATLANDGASVWTGANLTLTGMSVPTSAASFPFTITINSQANDASPGVDEYDWYVSQRTDDTTAQYFSVANPSVLPSTRSGTILVSLTAMATDLEYATPLDTRQILELFTDVDIYVKRRSDGLIQHKLLLDALLSD